MVVLMCEHPTRIEGHVAGGFSFRAGGLIDLLLAKHTRLSCPVSPADKLPV